MTYSEKLQDPRWQKKRLEVLQRDNFTCQLCNDTEEALHVHHISYNKQANPWEYEMNNFKTLCASCHKAQTIFNDIEIIKTLKKKSLDGLYYNVYFSFIEECGIIAISGISLNKDEGDKMINCISLNFLSELNNYFNG